MILHEFGGMSSDNRNVEEKELLLSRLRETPSENRPDRFATYSFRPPHTAESYYFSRTQTFLSSRGDEWSFFFAEEHEDLVAIAVHENKWDEEHFGFKMASLQIVAAPKSSNKKDFVAGVLKSILQRLKDKGVSYVSARVCGDHIVALHAFEDVGFRYFENVIWAVVRTKDLEHQSSVRLMMPEEIAEVVRIAETSQFRRGHFYCDERFDSRLVDSMYRKWVETFAANDHPITVLERDSKIAGFFAFTLDQELKEHSGYGYAHLRLLALDPAFRGKGAGRELFEGTLSLIKSMDIDFIDTGYASKNHLSARLHTLTGFFSAYDEVTFHLWLSDGNGRNI